MMLKTLIMVMPMYNLTEYIDVYSQTSGGLWQYYRDDNNNNITDFPVNNNNSSLFKFIQQITNQAKNGSTKLIAIMVPLKYLSKFGEHLKWL